MLNYMWQFFSSVFVYSDLTPLGVFIGAFVGVLFGAIWLSAYWPCQWRRSGQLL